MMKRPPARKGEDGFGHSEDGDHRQSTGVETGDAGATTQGKTGKTEKTEVQAAVKMRGRGWISWVRCRSSGKSTA
jgi:hypothetical protein